ncbi:MAG TPA: hypothetical protein VMG12_34680, partial [Polyangiaceae bacterium]|nr:hypothetical protein [Polyangiaceae bacterium]
MTLTSEAPWGARTEPLEASEREAPPARPGETPPGERPQPDAAAIDFARERERAVARSQHSAAVRRLHRAVKVGIPLWSATALLDVWVTTVIGAGNLVVFLALRALGVLMGLVIHAVLSRPREPSPRLLRWMDLGIYTWVSLLVSVMCVFFGGITSPYATGLITILVARAGTTLAPWRRGLWLLGVPA